ncbi:MAG: hypothetical protein RL322_309 [Pseudomonadota bacterium]
MSVTDPLGEAPAERPRRGPAAGPLEWAQALPTGIACVCAALMMVTTFFDVLLRYFAGRPMGGAFEITEISMGLLVFFALPSVMARRENIVVTLLVDRMTARTRAMLAALGDLVCALVLLFVAWRMWMHGARLLRFNEVTMELAVPKGAIAQTMAILLGLAALSACLAAWRGCRSSATTAGGARS